MKESNVFKEFYQQTVEKLDKKIKLYNKNLSTNKSPYLKNNLELFAKLNSDGKLVRGILVALGYKIMGGKDIDYSLDLSLAYEIFQTSVLIHDDIIDNDILRRGKETIHYANQKKYEKYSREEAKKVSESIAICIGDYGFYEANQIIINNYANDPHLRDVFNYYNDIILKTIEGELIDVILPFESKFNLLSNDLEKAVMSIYELKTAYYTIIGPLCLGMLLQERDNKKIEEITKLAKKIGIAFQIQDDILGIYNDMGKVIGSDIKEYKQTILYSYTYNSPFKQELLKYYGKEDLSDDNIAAVREIFKKSGAYDYAINYMTELYGDASSSINKLTWLTDENKEILLGFVNYLKSRQK